jgi:Asp/Glu/hydantoin racemase
VAVGVRSLERVVIAGLEHAEALYRPIMDNAGPLDVEAATEQVVAAAVALATAHPEVAALVLECTNLPPYAARIQAATGLPVWDAVSLVRWVHGAVHQRPYAAAARATASAVGQL